MPPAVQPSADTTPGARCIPRPVAIGRVSCVCDWLRDPTGLDSGDRSWICNAAQVTASIGIEYRYRSEPSIVVSVSAALMVSFEP